MISPPAASAASPAPTKIWSEDFENNVSGVTDLTDYRSTDGYDYSQNVASYYLDTQYCNGFIASDDDTSEPSGYCEGQGSQWTLPRAMAWGIGQINGLGSSNNALSASTIHANSSDPAPPANGVIFQTPQINLGTKTATSGEDVGTGRFIVFSVDAAADNCDLDPPLYDFNLIDSSGNSHATTSSPINACTPTADDSTGLHVTNAAEGVSHDGESISYGHYYTGIGVLVPGSSVALQLRNQSTSIDGDDAAFDDPTILDGTPTLTKSFASGASVRATTKDTATLTYTVTNTADLAQKDGWSFTDNLPSGMEVADTPNFTSTCMSDTQITSGGADSTSISFKGGIDQNVASCTLSIDVQAVSTVTDPATLTNGPSNIADLTGLDFSGSTSLDVVGCADGVHSCSLQLTKSATVADSNNDTYTDNGDVVTYTFTVTNTGDYRVNKIAVDDPMLTAAGDTITADGNAYAAPGATITFTATHTIGTGDSLYDVSGGTTACAGPGKCLENTATASGTAATGEAVTSNSSTYDVQLTSAPAKPSIQLEETVAASNGDSASAAKVGDVVTFTYKATNDGNVDLSNVALTGVPSGFTVSGGSTTLAQNATTTFTATHTVTQADVDAQTSWTSPGKVTGEDSDGTSVEATGSQTATVETAAPAVSLTESVAASNGDAATAAKVGDVVTFTYVVQNTGNVTLSNLTLTGVPSGYTLTGGATSLAPSKSTTYTATYTVTQADVNNQVSWTSAGMIEGTPPTGSDVTDNGTATASVEKAAPAVSLTESVTASNGDPATAAKVGDVITFTYVVQNTGNVPLSSVTLTPGTPTTPEWTQAPPPLPVLDVGSPAVTWTVTHTVTQADVDSQASWTSPGHVDGTPPSGAHATADGTATATVEKAAPAVSLTESVSASNGDPATAAKVGDVITFTYVVQNTGNVTLSADTLTGVPTGFTLTGGSATLAPQASATYEATRTVTQSDVDHQLSWTSAGHIDGTSPQGTHVTADDSKAAAVVAESAVLTATKQAYLDSAHGGTDKNGDGKGDLGDVIAYTVTLTNNGNVTLFNVTPTDDLAGVTGFQGWTPTPDAQLAPGASYTWTATYTVQQSDIDNPYIDSNGDRVVHNIAGGSSQDALSNEVDAAQTWTNTVVADPDPSLAAAKSWAWAAGGDVNGNNLADAGDVIAYTVTLTNTGNVTLSGVLPTDQMAGVSAFDAGPQTLAPGASYDWHATYTVQQSDIDYPYQDSAGDYVVHNIADGAGTAPGGAAVTAPAAWTNTPVVPQSPGLAVQKSWTWGKDANGNGKADLGDVIDYAVKITNTGNVTLTGVAPSDAMAGLSGWDAGAKTLAPGASFTWNATYTVTQLDIDTYAGGTIHNTASGSGTTPRNQPFSGPTSSTDTPVVDPDPSIAIKKTGVLIEQHGAGFQDGKADAGEQVNYSFEVTNTGNVTLHDVAVADPMLTGLSPVDISLAPGETEPFTADLYTVTQADVDNGGSIVNTATATGVSPQTTTVQAQDSYSQVVADPVPGLVVLKSAHLNDTNGNGYADLGETIDYSFAVTNTGNVTMHDVAVSDSRVTGLDPATIPSIAPGTTVTVTADPYTVVQADLDDGDVYNSATVSGTPPQSLPPFTSPPSTVTVPVPPAVLTASVVKSGKLTVDRGVEGIADWGDTETYTFVVTNTGNRTEHDVSVIDTDLPGLTAILPASVPTLAPGASTSYTATYTITDPDVARGYVTNQATAQFTPPQTRTGPVPTPMLSDPSNVVKVPVRQPVAPPLASRTSKRVIQAKAQANGAIRPVRFYDQITESGYVAGSPGFPSTGTVSLYGPFSAPVKAGAARLKAGASTLSSSVGCTSTPVASMPFTPQNGTFRTAKVTVSKVGYYVWVARSTADHFNLASTESCGRVVATTKVERAPYPVPDIETGFTGLEPHRVDGRKAPVRTGSISIPALGIHAPVVTSSVVGGAMQLPPVSQTAWLPMSAATGEPFGATVIAGHVSDDHDTPGAFYRLQGAKKGELATVRTGVGSTERFRFAKVLTYQRGHRLPKSLFETGGAHELVLITCTGRVVYANGHFHYTKFRVVIAKPVR